MIQKLSSLYKMKNKLSEKKIRILRQHIYHVCRVSGQVYYLWVTSSGKIGARNKNFAIKYFRHDQIKEAKIFCLNNTKQRRDYSAERYERKRRMFFF